MERLTFHHLGLIKLVFWTMALFSGVQLWGQQVASLSLNPKVGINFADMQVGQANVDATLAKLGWNVGVDASYGRKLTVVGGLHYFQLGSLIQMKDEDLTASIRSSQIKLPVGLSFPFISVDYLKVFARGDLVGTYTFNFVEGTLRKKVTDYDRLGMASRITLGIQLSRFSLEINYEDNLANISRDITYAHNQTVSVLVGIKL